jgi:hypothetical protein
MSPAAILGALRAKVLFGVPLVQILNRLAQFKSFLLRFSLRAAEQPAPRVDTNFDEHLVGGKRADRPGGHLGFSFIHTSGNFPSRLERLPSRLLD